MQPCRVGLREGINTGKIHMRIIKRLQLVMQRLCLAQLCHCRLCAVRRDRRKQAEAPAKLHALSQLRKKRMLQRNPRTR